MKLKTILGEKVTKFLGYFACGISFICFFVLIYLELFTGLKIKLEDILICLACAIIFFISAKIKGKKEE